MTYQQTLEFLFNNFPVYHKIGKAAYKANLDNTLALDEYFGNPHLKFKTIHVAGTNGKGSVSHMIASVLQEAGYKTALYTSPHLMDFRERIKINGTMISEAEVVDFVTKHDGIIKELRPSFFELTVAMAFDWFARCEVDVAVVEVGLGGRLDSTNIITPELSVITNIGLEHTDILGDTREKIAFEKSGIIKHNVPVVIGESHPETTPVFKAKASEMGSNILFADTNFRAQWNDDSVHAIDTCRKYHVSGIDEDGNDQKESFFVAGDIPLCGDYQLKNLQTVAAAFQHLRWPSLSKENLVAGIANVIKNTGLLGRWQVISKKPLTVCDTGHNKHGMTYTVKQLSSIKKRQLHCVLGFSNDKDVNAILQMFPKDAVYYFTKAGIDRAMDTSMILSIADNCGLKGEEYPTVRDAYAAAKSNATVDDLIFIGGSIFVVAEVL